MAIYEQFRASVDFMKKMKDTVTSQLSTAEKITLANLAVDSYCNYGAFDVPVVTQTELVNAGVTPSPRTIDDEWQDWCDVMHDAGLGIIFRSASAGMEGIYNQTHLVGGSRRDAGTYADLFPEDSEPVYDDFERVSIGADYTTAADGGSGNDWSIVSGQLFGPAADGWRRSILTTASYTDFMATCKVKKIGNQQLVGRATTDSNFPGYGFQLRDGEFRLERPGIEQLGTAAKTFTENNWYWIKIECLGTTIKGKVWAADDSTYPNSTDGSENEPVSWDISITNSNFSSGMVGVSGESSNGYFDKLTITELGGTPDFNNWMGYTYNWIVDHADCFNDIGDTPDVFAFYPERTEGIFDDSTAFLPNTGAGIQANYRDFYRQLNLVAAKAFEDIGKPNIILSDTANNYSEPRSGWLPQAFFDDAQRIAVDYYLNYNNDGYSADQAMTDMIYLYDNRGGYRLCWQEYGPIQTDGQTDEDRAADIQEFCDALMAQLITTGKLEEMNFWVWWEGQNTSFLNKTGSGASSVYSLNGMGEVMKTMYKTIRDTIYQQQHPPTPTIKASPFTQKNNFSIKKL